jgi:hypothetical protein
MRCDAPIVDFPMPTVFMARRLLQTMPLSKERRLRTYGFMLLIYFVGLIPAYALAGVLEGASRHLWMLRLYDWLNQGSAFLLMPGALMALASPVAVPVLEWMLRRFDRRKHPVRLLAAAVAAPIAILVGAFIVAQISSLSSSQAGNPSGALSLLAFPLAFLGTSAAYGIVALLLVESSSQELGVRP